MKSMLTLGVIFNLNSYTIHICYMKTFKEIQSNNGFQVSKIDIFSETRSAHISIA